jgi:peptide/nickel transport system substrate-binding protein
VEDAMNGWKAGGLVRPRTYALLVAVLWIGVFVVGVFQEITDGALASTPKARSGGVFRIVARSADVGPLDPALEYTGASGILVDTTCARLAEVAPGSARVSDGRRTYTFALRSGFRFSDGTPVRASAFARAINRVLAPGIDSPFAPYLRDIVGADETLKGRTPTAAGLTARGNTLIVRLERPVPDFLLRTGFLCAVPPTLPVDPEGVGAFPAAGPYYIAEYRAAERIVIRRNRFYGGKRPHHVDGFTVDLRASSFDEVLDRVERGDADWGFAIAAAYLDPARGLAARYGINKSQFFLTSGFGFRGFAFNTSRPLFRNNPNLRKAVNFAIDRSALRRAGGGALESRLSDQYLPPTMRGFRDVRIYPLDGPDLRRARALARGHRRGGKAVLYTVDSSPMPAFAQSIRQDLAKIGLDVTVKVIPLTAYFGRLGATGPYDIGFAPWLADYDDPYAVLNVLLDGRFVGSTNWARFDSPEYNRLLRRAARLQGAARQRAYGELDVRLARDAAPLVAIDYTNEPTLVSKRVGCVTPQFDLTAVCLK